MKENYIRKEILEDSLERCFWDVMDARIYFIDELLYSDFMDYTLDIAGDSTDLQTLLHKSSDDYVQPYIARKISLYYKAEQDLMHDIKYYLSKNYAVNYDTELAKRKAKRNAKKEGK